MPNHQSSDSYYYHLLISGDNLFQRCNQTLRALAQSGKMVYQSGKTVSLRLNDDETYEQIDFFI